jgi:putative tryptophan/tyrosine transport system substrate-binding protein
MIVRRDFVLAFGAGALVAPLLCFAQQWPATIPRVGVLDPASSDFAKSRSNVLRDALRELGYVEGKNILFDCRWAEGNYERLPGLAAELVASRVNVIVAATPPAMQAVRSATSTIPIVMIAIPNPVEAGYVASLSRPGGNITGLSNISVDLSSKYLELLRAAVPNLSRVALLVNPRHPNHPEMVKNAEVSAAANRVKVLSFEASTASQIESAVIAMMRERVGALIVLPDAFYSNQRRQIVELATKNRLPTMFWTRELAEAGGLMSYGQSNSDHFRLAATYVDKILRGAKPGDLPVQQPTRIELIVNRKTANAIGLALPEELLTRADMVIE